MVRGHRAQVSTIYSIGHATESQSWSSLQCVKAKSSSLQSDESLVTIDEQEFEKDDKIFLPLIPNSMNNESDMDNNDDDEHESCPCSTERWTMDKGVRIYTKTDHEVRSAIKTYEGKVTDKEKHSSSCQTEVPPNHVFLPI